LRDAQREVEKWKEDYNHRRPHSALMGLTPNEVMRQFVDQPKKKEREPLFEVGPKMGARSQFKNQYD